MSAITLLCLLLPFISLSCAQSDSSQSSSSMSSSTSSMASLNSTMSPSLTSSAQFPSLSGYSTCVTNCLAVGIARVNCTSLTDVNCFCVNSTFPAEVFGCIQSDCPSELMTEEKLDQQFCNLASSSPTLTFPSPIPSTSSTSSSASTAFSSPSKPTPSATSTTSDGATLYFWSGLFSGFLLTVAHAYYLRIL